MQPQSFAHRQPRTPQAKGSWRSSRRACAAEWPPVMRSRRRRCAVMSCRCTRACWNASPCATGSGVAPHGTARPRARRCPDAPLDARAGAASAAPSAQWRAQRTRRCQRVIRRASACSSAAEQGKLADLTKILGDHIVGLRVRRIEVLLRRRVRHRAEPAVAGSSQGRPSSVNALKTSSSPTWDGVVVSEYAQAWERFLCLRGEPYPSLRRFVFVYSWHSYTLLARGLPATVVATWLGTSRSMIPARQSCRRRWSMCVMIAARRLLHEGHRSAVRRACAHEALRGYERVRLYERRQRHRCHTSIRVG